MGMTPVRRLIDAVLDLAASDVVVGIASLFAAASLVMAVCVVFGVSVVLFGG